MKRFTSALLILMLTLSLCPALGEEAPDYTYHSRGQGLFRLGNTGYLVEYWGNFLVPQYLNNVRRNSEQWNRYIPQDGSVKRYIYFIENSRAVDLSGDLSGENETWIYIKGLYQADGYATLALDTAEDYLNWFYKTDQHWNYKGSYKGYCDIVRMMLGEDEPLMVPAETVVFPDIPFNGAFNSKLGYSGSDELFTVYRFEGMRDYTMTINGYPGKTYGQAETYFKGKYPRITVYNHYGRFYGGDAGELIIDTNQPEKPNLLILGNSYSNAVTLLLAQHFNRVYSIDPRFYRLRMKTNFHMGKYLEKNGITYVLALGDFRYYMQSFSLR